MQENNGNRVILGHGFRGGEAALLLVIDRGYLVYVNWPCPDQMCWGTIATN
jgi:hypothetical protein